jgi:hypothetical protein
MSSPVDSEHELVQGFFESLYGFVSRNGDALDKLPYVL